MMTVCNSWTWKWNWGWEKQTF